MIRVGIYKTIVQAVFSGGLPSWPTYPPGPLPAREGGLWPGGVGRGGPGCGMGVAGGVAERAGGRGATVWVVAGRKAPGRADHGFKPAAT